MTDDAKPRNTESRIRDAIVAFPWWNYGLDDVGEANPEYAAHLARQVVEVISTPPEFRDPAMHEPGFVTPTPEEWVAHRLVVAETGIALYREELAKVNRELQRAREELAACRTERPWRMWRVRRRIEAPRPRETSEEAS